MRIRQIRPEFFTDPVTAHLSPLAQITYIGLWCVADDAGWLAWDVPQLGALLSPYKSVRVRERAVEKAGQDLVEVGRLIIYPCGCALIPKLETHQKIGGNKSFTARDRHAVHTRMDKSARNVTVSEGRVSNGSLAPAPEGGAARDFKERLIAAGIKASIVGPE